MSEGNGKKGKGNGKKGNEGKEKKPEVAAMLPDSGTRFQGGPLTRVETAENTTAKANPKKTAKAKAVANPMDLQPELEPTLISNAPKRFVSSTVIPELSPSTIPIIQVQDIPDQSASDKGISITYGVIGPGAFLAEQISPTQLNSASLADATQASIDITAKVL
jgi:hypothetical protein